MSKKLTAVLLILVVCTAFATADSLKWNSNYKEGNVALSLDAGYEVGNEIELSLYPAAELIILKPDFDNVSFLDLGAKLMVRAGFGFPALDLGVGIAGTAHFGFKDIFKKELGDYIDPIDVFLEIGACFDFLSTSNFPFGLVANSGINYWFEDNFALGLKYTHWNSFDGVSISAHWNFKNQKKAEKAINKTLDT